MTIKEIAKIAGVSISTISKVINGKDSGINPQTREHVLKVVKEYNYRPYAKAIANSDTKTFLLGVLTSSMPPSVLWGIRVYAQEKGYIIYALNSRGDRELELKQLTALLLHNLDGLIWEPVDPETAVNRSHAEALNIPCLTMVQHGDDTAYHIDYAGLGYFLTERLIERRHTNIACLIDPAKKYSNSVIEGYKRCLYDNSINYSDDLIQTTDTISDAIVYQKISGVLSTSFTNALRFYKSMMDLHYQIPGDVSLVSLREDGVGEIPYPAISGVDIPFLEFGEYICQRLINICESKDDYPAHTLFTTQPVLSGVYSVTQPPENKKKRIIVIGALNMDVTLNVEKLPAAGATTLASSSLHTLGGKGANQAVGASRLGQEVFLLGKVGNDVDAAKALTILSKEDISTTGVLRDTEGTTGKAFIQQQKDGESTITVLSGANSQLLPSDIEPHQRMFAKAGFCLLSTEIPIDTVVTAARLAARHQVKTILKPAAIHTLPDQLLQSVDIFVPNESEARTLCGNKTMSVEEQARLFRDMGAATVIITLGERGCYYLDEHISGGYPASDLLTVDTTGGADAFISALASYLSDGFSLEQAVRIATYSAGFCISRVGVTTALVDKMTLENYIRRVEPELLRRY